MKLTPLARLHLVTDDDVLRAPDFAETAAALLDRFGASIALQIRGHGLSGRSLHELAASLAPAGAVFVNDRVDVALATAAAGVQLGRRSIPVAYARRLLGTGRLIGFSAHAAGEATAALEAGADFVIAGAIHATASHPGVEGGGLGLLRRVVAACRGAPVIAIGGITPARAAAAMEAGADGVAVLSGVWRAPDPARAVADYFRAAPGLRGKGESEQERRQ